MEEYPNFLSTQQEHGFQPDPRPDPTKIELKITPFDNCKEYGELAKHLRPQRLFMAVCPQNNIPVTHYLVVEFMGLDIPKLF